ncbi:hypothetical protein PENTCL1PPCAC_18660, partial [Pristionchus entomophagus]
VSFSDGSDKKMQLPSAATGRCCCGLSVTLGSRILALISGFMALCQVFTVIFFYNWSDYWMIALATLLYCVASMLAAALVFQAIRTHRAVFMSPMLLISTINIVALVIALITCAITAFGGYTTINDEIERQLKWCAQNIDGCQQWQEEMRKDDLAAYECSTGWWLTFSAFFIMLFAVWVFIVHFDCFRTIKAGEGYPTAHYHGNDNITVPIYPTYPAPAYDAADRAATANPAPPYPGTPYDIPPSYTNEAVTTADETPVKVPLP